MRTGFRIGWLARMLPVWAAAIGCLGAGGALADPIGPDCGTCQGSIYTLAASAAPIATSPTTQTFRISLTIDSSGYSGEGTGIDTVAIKVSSALIAAELVQAPLGIANWDSYLNRGLSASGCSRGGGGFECATVSLQSGAGIVPDVGGTLIWAWDLEIETDSLLTGPFESSVKARYVNDSRRKVGALVSEDVTLGTIDRSVIPIPEPGSFALLGLGLALLRARPQRGSRRR